MDQKTIAFHHFGCKVNYAEASTLSRQFKEKGFELLDFKEKADIYVISTCVVTAVAEKKCRAAIRQAHKLNPAARIAVIGCFSELKPDEISGMEGVDLVLGHTGKFSLMEELEKLDGIPQNTTDYHAHLDAETFIPSFSYGDRTRSFLKVQDGCDYFCSYCTIPLARGHSRSDTIANVIANAKEVSATGIREIILTGVNIGDFGHHNGETFAGLVDALENTEEIPRIRISSIEPDLLNDAIIEKIAVSKRFMPHFHIPLQSGNDRVLSAMKRKYNCDLYASRVRNIHALLPSACIAADVIVGFPGETDEEFESTYEFINSLNISYLHVFTYSKRDHTLAGKMTDPVQDKVKKERSDRLHHLSELKKKEFYLQNIGKEAHVLFESDNSEGFMHGFTENYIRVKTKYDPGLVNQIVPVTLNKIDPDGTFIR